MRLHLAVALSTLLSATSLFAQKETEAPRIVSGLRNADQLNSDLKYMVDDLAGKKDSWENNIFPNIDIFLFGVDTTRPVRYDVLFKEAEGVQYQLMVPVKDEDLDVFLEDNLDPIGIIPKKDRRERDLFKLTGNVFEGWLRYLEDDGYTVITKDKADVPKEMPNPDDKHKHLVEAGYLIFAEFNNAADGIESRRKAFEKYKSNAIEKLQKTPTESKESFELKKASATLTMDILGLYFSEAKQMRYGLTIDQEKHVGVSDLLFSALPDTKLTENMNEVGKEPSRFAALQAPEDAVLDVHVNFPVDDIRQKAYANLYELSRPVVAEKIDQDADASDTEKTARKQVSKLIQDILIETCQRGLIDIFAEISPQGEHHKVLVSTTCNATEKIAEIVRLLPEAQTGWTVEEDLETVHEVVIHKLALGEKAPESLSTFYGNSRTIYLGVGKDTFWLSGGVDALETLKQAITKVTETESGESDKVLVDVKMKAGSLLKVINDFSKEEHLGILKMFQPKAYLQKKTEENKGNETKRPGSKATGALANFEWQPAAIASLQDENDSVTFLLKMNEEGNIIGSGNGQKGILKAFGAILAKFADENLQ